jgi:hypothetical protein
MIADLNTGQVRKAGCLDSGYHWEHPELPTGLRYRVDSSLLVAYGCIAPNRTCGGHFYEMRVDGLHLACFSPFRGKIIEPVLPIVGLPGLLEQKKQ